MQQNILNIQQRIESLRQQIVHHKVYQEIKDLEDLQIFMHYHVYAVWDFMSLLKALQQQLTCVTVPWFPTAHPNTRYLINEIVLGEETDIDEMGVRKSHYELYLEAIEQTGASTQFMTDFLTTLQATSDFQKAYAIAQTPQAAQEFMNQTFDVIAQGKAHVQAAVFTFGREDLIPNMFITMVNDIHKKFPDQVAIYKYYLERHIEVDGDHHSHLAMEMTSELCGNDTEKWREAEQATITSLEKRIALWNGAYEALLQKRKA